MGGWGDKRMVLLEGQVLGPDGSWLRGSGGGAERTYYISVVEKQEEAKAPPKWKESHR